MTRGNKRARTSTPGQDESSSASSKTHRVHCNYCRKEITNIVRIKCAVCRDVELCVECFGAGAELEPHRKDHAYRVVGNMNFPILTQDWGADEELLLLEGIELRGLGNWRCVRIRR